MISYVDEEKKEKGFEEIVTFWSRVESCSLCGPRGRDSAGVFTPRARAAFYDTSKSNTASQLLDHRTSKNRNLARVI